MIYLQLQFNLLRTLEHLEQSIHATCIPQLIGMGKCVLQTTDGLQMTDKTIKTDARLDLCFPAQTELFRFKQDFHRIGVPLLGRMLVQLAFHTVRAQRSGHKILWHSPTSGRPSFLNVSSLAV